MISNKLDNQSILPLTCSRKGTCCHGNAVYLNPWELVKLSEKKQMSPRDFRDRFCDLGGILLSFNGRPDDREKKACSQYIENFGCSVHEGRPLACRLFPLGRLVQNGVARYIFQGKSFPCLNGCPEVKNLPYLTVEDYLKGQLIDPFEQAQDEYLEVMQNLADIAFTLLLDTGLSPDFQNRTISVWEELGNSQEQELLLRIEKEWIDILVLPSITEFTDDAISFARKHNELLQNRIQEKYGSLNSDIEWQEASIQIMGITLYLARALGADPQQLAEYWNEIARENGVAE
jgi:Fe-S-cluster containining protein